MTPKELRIKWMTEYGHSQEEIEESLETDPPVSLEEEQKHMDAVNEIKNTDLSWLGPTIRKIKKENGLDEDARVIVCLSCRGIVDFPRDDDPNYAECKCKACHLL